MNKSNHPDLKRLEQLLEENPAWAVKITDKDRNDEPQRLHVNGKKLLWIHHHHLTNGLQPHVVLLAKERNIKNMGFEIKRKNGTHKGRTNYISPSKSSLSNPFFSIPFTTQNNENVNVNNSAFTKAEQSPRMETPKLETSVLSGLSGAQVADFIGNSIHKTYLERDLIKIEAENNALRPENERLKARVLELENEKLIAERPKTGQKIFDSLQENPAILKELFTGIAMLVPKESTSSGLKGQAQTVEPARSPQKTKLINHIDEHDDDKAQLLGDVALLMDKDDDFSSSLADLVREAYSKLLKPA